MYTGLTSGEAREKLLKYGFNEIKEVHKVSKKEILIRQVKGNYLILLLLLASIISFLVSHIITAVVILLDVCMMISFGFFQEYKAEKAISALKNLLTPTVLALRDGKERMISVREIVPDDIIFLREGSIVPADCIILNEKELEVNEAVLTGESLPVSKSSAAKKADSNENMIFMATPVVNGKCTAKVLHTGMNTKYGKIAFEISTIEKDIPLRHKVNKLATIMASIAVTLSLFLGILLIIKSPVLSREILSDILLVVISLTVSAFPEGFPIVLTIALAAGTNAMAKKNAIVNRMSSVEAMGSVTVICVPGNTPIICEPSIKTIDSIIKGDRVLGLDGKFHNVSKTFRRDYSGKMVYIKPIGLPILKITPEHPILIAKMKRHRPLLNLNNIISRPRKIEILKPQWVNASEVEEGDLVAIPRIKVEELFKLKIKIGREGKEKELDLDEELAELFGWYLAEGCCGINKGSYYIIFYLGKNEKENVERVKYLIEKKLGLKAYVRQNRTSISITAINKDLVYFLRENFGERAINKRLPNFILNAKKQVIAEFLKGYLKGDGNISKYYIRFTTVSKTLTFQLIILLAKLGIRCRLHERKEREDFIEGRKVNIHKCYELFINGSQADLIHPVLVNLKERKNNLSLLDDNFVYVPIKEVSEKQESLEVFNIETESNTYTLPFVVHNCTDKTGTITKGEMTAVKIFVNDNLIEISGSGYSKDGKFFMNKKEISPHSNYDLTKLLKAVTLCNDASIELSKNNQFEIRGSPTEASLLVLSSKANFSKDFLYHHSPRLDEILFTSEKKFMSTLHKTKTGTVQIYKGAFEKIIEKCSYYAKDGRKINLTPELKKKIHSQNETFGKEGLRVIAIAYKENVTKIEDSNFIFLGLIALSDPPREEVKDALLTCKKAGIRVIMLTGDNEHTASSIASQIGLIGKTITGEELSALNDEELSIRLKDTAVFARINPEHKLRIVRLLKKQGEIVAMTGDGINDAPALKEADVGISMGIKGTDVSREVSDIVLKDDNFSSITSAIEGGRTIFNNIRKFTTYQFSCNYSELFIILTGVLLNFPLPLLALQILFMNLVTDDLPAITLSFNPKSKDIMEIKPRPATSNIMNKHLLILMAVLGTAMGVGSLMVFRYGLSFSLEHARTITFITLIFFQIFNAFSFRSLRKTIWNIDIFKNKWLIIASSISVLALLTISYTPLNKVFGIIVIPFTHWIYSIVIAFSIIIVADIIKLIYGKKSYLFYH